MGKEKAVEENLKRWLTSKGIYPLGVEQQKIKAIPVGYYDKRWGGGQFTKSGLPDMQIVINGKCLEVELKAGSGKPTLLQLRMLEQIHRSGGYAYIVTDTLTSAHSIRLVRDKFNKHSQIKVLTLDEFKDFIGKNFI